MPAKTPASGTSRWLRRPWLRGPWLRGPWLRGPWLRRSTSLFFLLLLVAALVGGVILAGRWGQDQLRGSARYDVPFSDVACEPPAGMTRQEFLDEVLYVARLPRRLHLLDEDLSGQLQEGFALHPWVEKVEAVDLQPPRRIVVRLRHRTPVLAVQVGEKWRAVDGQGVLLPANAPTRGLPVYDAQVTPPRGPAGTRWGDPNLEAAAREYAK